MPKINWAGEGQDEEDILTAEDIEAAESNGNAYAGELPPAGVYRFRIGRMKFIKASTGTKGLNVRMTLDGSWKPGHKKYEGAPLWDRVYFTKGAAAFVKAFAQAIGVSASDILNKVVADEDGYVTKIGRTKIEPDEIEVYCLVKHEEYDGEDRLAKSGTGFQIIEDEEPEEEDEEEEDEEETPPKKSSKAAAKPASKKRAPEPEEDEEEKDEEDEDEEPPARPAKKSAKAPAKKTAPKGKARSRRDDDEPPF